MSRLEAIESIVKSAINQKVVKTQDEITNLITAIAKAFVGSAV